VLAGRLLFVSSLCFTATCFAFPRALAPTNVNPAFERASHLRHGINASWWFAQMGNYSPQRLNTFITPTDFELIHRLGFDHVRLPIDPTPLADEAPANGLNASYLALLDNAVGEILENQLNAVLVIFPEDRYKSALSESPQAQQAFVRFWAAFAAHYAAYDPQRVFFEILNEPNVKDWPTLEEQVAKAIRLAAPEHTIIATAGRYSGLADLLRLQPLPLDNVIYTFHYYLPREFAQQGADPKGAYSYPSKSPDSGPDEKQTLDLQFQINEYDFEEWNSAHIASEISYARKWSDLYHAPVWCGEFGVDISREDMSSGSAAGAMRAAWLHDVRVALEQNGIGWAMWDYRTPNFGLVTYPQGTPVADPRALTALGLP
jgi:endoglucanase